MRLRVSVLLLVLVAAVGVVGVVLGFIPSMVTSSGSTVSAGSSTLQVNRAGTGSGTVSGVGISCGSDCTENFLPDTSANLTASSASGSAFGGWSGDCSGSSAVVNVSMAANRTCTATFNAVPSPPPEDSGGGDGGGVAPPQQEVPGITAASTAVDNFIESADGSVALEVPGGAVDFPLIIFSVQTFDEPSVDEPLPEDTELVSKVTEVSAVDPRAGYTEVTAFQEDITISFNVDPEAISDIPVEEFVVAFWDKEKKEWVPIPTKVDRETGKVSGIIKHFTTFAVLRVGSVTHQLVGGPHNSVVFTGPSGTSAEEIADAIGSSLEIIWYYNAPLRKWQFYASAFPEFSTLETVNSRDVLFFRMEEGALVDWRVSNLIPAPSGERGTAVLLRWNYIGYVGPDGTEVSDLLAQTRAIKEYAVFDQERRVWLRGDLAESLNRLDVLAVYSTAQKTFELVLPESK